MRSALLKVSSSPFLLSASAYIKPDNPSWAGRTPQTRIGLDSILRSFSSAPVVQEFVIYLRSDQIKDIVSHKVLYKHDCTSHFDTYLLLCIVSMSFPVNHHNFLELTEFFFQHSSFSARVLNGGFTSTSCCSVLQNHVCHGEWKKPQKEGRGTLVLLHVWKHTNWIQLFCSRKVVAEAQTLGYGNAALIKKKDHNLRKYHGSGRKRPLCGWINNSHIGTRKNYSAVPVWDGQ